MVALSKKKNITVLGCGDVGLATAAEFSTYGYNVNMLEHPDFKKSIIPLMEKKEIKFSGELGSGSAKINMVTTNAEKALKDSSIIILTAPAYAHESLVRFCTPHLDNGQIFLIKTGYFGALRFSKIINDTGKKVVLAEMNITPYCVRKISPNEILVYAKKKEPALAAMPTRETRNVFNLIKAVYPGLIKVKNVLYTSLDCPNWLIHPIKTLLHMGLIERSKYYSLPQKDSIPPSVLKLMNIMDKERIELGKVFSFNLPTLNNFWESGGKTIGEAIRNCVEHETYNYEYKDSWMKHLDEDLYFGLPTWSSLAKLVNVPTPLTNSIINIFSSIRGIDYMKKGITIEKIGFKDLSIKEVNKILEEGF